MRKTEKKFQHDFLEDFVVTYGKDDVLLGQHRV